MNNYAQNRSLTLPGLYVGQVTAVEDPENMGRIQVQIPSVFASDQPSEYAWARPCFHFGHFFVPEIDSKVWLAFENGDPSMPVWLGIWYPSGSTPSEAQVSPPSVRLIRSTQGHLVIFDDTDGSEAVIVKDKFGSSIELREESVKIKAMADLTIDASGVNVIIKASNVDVQS